MTRALLAMEGIRVEFPGVLAVEDADLRIEAGEVRAIVGENGAGKSTLMKVLAGLYPTGSHAGRIRIDDEPVRFATTADAERAGVVMIPQEMNMVDDRSVAENIFLGTAPTRFGIIDQLTLLERAAKALERVDLRISPTTMMGELGTAQKQMVAIAAALSKDVRVLILDEPTSTLSGHESEILFAQIERLRAGGIACLYISHRLEEVLRISDRVTVMRDGRVIDTRESSSVVERGLVELMIGRDLGSYFPSRDVEIGEVVMRAEGISVSHPIVPGVKVVDDVSFDVRAGEVLGVFGLVGAGRTEMASALVGHGEGAFFRSLSVKDKRVDRMAHPREALDIGLGYLPEDRKTTTVLPNLDVARNISVGSLRALTRGGRIVEEAELSLAERFRKELRIKTSRLNTPVATLSGGNQQKAMIARLIAQRLPVLVLDEPTQGVDVGAKAEIYTILNALVSEGAAVVMISSDLPEVVGMSDRVMVMHRGSVAGVVDPKEMSERDVLELAALGADGVAR